MELVLRQPSDDELLSEANGALVLALGEGVFASPAALASRVFAVVQERATRLLPPGMRLSNERAVDAARHVVEQWMQGHAAQQYVPATRPLIEEVEDDAMPRDAEEIAHRQRLARIEQEAQAEEARERRRREEDQLRQRCEERVLRSQGKCVHRICVGRPNERFCCYPAVPGHLYCHRKGHGLQ